MAENIVHLVLARTPDAPPGVKGISLFIAPKFLVKADGSPGARNDVHCVSIEHKLGIKASPTAVLQFGDHGGAIGTLVGEENRGIEYMFIMMNAARFGVGIQGIGLAERSYQHAVAFAKDRVQSRDVAGSAASVAIIHHPDVRRMLMSMRAQTEAARALAYVGAGISDIAHHHPDAVTRAANPAAVIAQQKLEAGAGDAQFYQAKIGTARFFADHILSQSSGLRAAIINGSAGVLALSEDQF